MRTCVLAVTTPILALFAACTSTSAPSPAAPDSGDAPDAAVGADASPTDATDAGAKDATSATDGASASTFMVTVGGIARTVTYIAGHKRPFQGDMGLHARLSAQGDAGVDGGFDDLLIFIGDPNASGAVTTAGVTFEYLAGGTQFLSYANPDAAAGGVTGLSIGAIGGFIDGAFAGTVHKTIGSETHAVSGSFHVLRTADSDLL